MDSIRAHDNAQLEDSKVGEEVVLASGDLVLEVVLHEAQVGRVIPVLSVSLPPKLGNRETKRMNAPTPEMSSWMTSVREEGVCHSLRFWAGTGAGAVAAMMCDFWVCMWMLETCSCSSTMAACAVVVDRTERH